MFVVARNAGTNREVRTQADAMSLRFREMSVNHAFIGFRDAALEDSTLSANLR